MQIFFTNRDPAISARNIHFRFADGSFKLSKKMTLESFQLLCLQIKQDGICPEPPVGAPNAHISHESRMWLDYSTGNVRWLLDHANELVRLSGCPNGKKLNSDSIRYLNQIITSNYPKDKITPAALAMRSTSLDLCKKYGMIVEDMLTYSGKPKTFFLGKTVDSAVTAYRTFLSRKDYFNPKHAIV